MTLNRINCYQEALIFRTGRCEDGQTWPNCRCSLWDAGRAIIKCTLQWCAVSGVALHLRVQVQSLVLSSGCTTMHTNAVWIEYYNMLFFVWLYYRKYIYNLASHGCETFWFHWTKLSAENLFASGRILNSRILYLHSFFGLGLYIFMFSFIDTK